MDSQRATQTDWALMMDWRNAWQWVSRHVVPGIDEQERQATQGAIERAHRVADTWDARTNMSKALQWEREFWSKVHEQRKSGDG